ncbi:toxin CptA [Pseudomonas pohangensis]|uniref:Toxin CptA n=1 Tax=Pseudomonas pohangensis TaxID=364197 RepID=A0A1H2EPQ0_9PSED|nr:protein YgfX [Pseudomonas pohangensis]SDT96933.1 toxin CptA [Pseudomonas pohangensis]
MSNPSEFFECHWQPSRCLLALYLFTLTLAISALWLTAIPFWAALVATLLCLAHACRVLPGQILLGRPASFSGLRHDGAGWHLRTRSGEWLPVQLRPDSLALPLAVILRFRLAGERRVRGLCILPDALDAATHRRLRVRLKFSRRRWAAAE